jgi:hypothetical protein
MKVSCIAAASFFPTPRSLDIVAASQGGTVAVIEWPEAPSILTVIGHFPEAVIEQPSTAGWSSAGPCMRFELITVDGRFFDLDVWDWAMMLVGSLLVGLVALLG